MTKRKTFDAEKANLDEACQELRWFTLARRGATRKSGLRAVARVNAVCARMTDLYSKGRHALRLASILQSLPRTPDISSLDRQARLAVVAAAGPHG